MPRKTGLDIKKGILEALKKGDCSLRELETRLNTNYLTIKRHVEELKYLGHIELIKISKNPRTGRSSSVVKLVKK